uniref:Putative tick transposon n=1 Tax=Rhipicephalus pulchellus TaxID=72859 RepID=L7LZ34_RHIPC
MSPLLFALYLESLCLSIIQSSHIRGFNILGSEVKVLAYADDVAIFCTDKPSVENVITTIGKFGVVSGARLNSSKSLGLWFGSWGSTPNQFAGINWTRTPPKYLGVPLDAYRFSARYWKERVPMLERQAQAFIPYRLSIFGRAKACNTFLATKLYYVLQLIHCARFYVQRFHRIFATFIWSSTFEPMRRDNIFRQVSDGGLGLKHLYIWQTVSRFFFFRDSSHPIIRSFLQVTLVNSLPDIVVSSNFSARPCLWGFMQEVYFAVQFLKARFSMEYLYTVSRKTLYKDLLSMLFPPPLYRSSYFDLPGHDVLERVRKMYISPNSKTFFYKLHSETLPVKTWLQRKGIFVSTVNCRLCDVPETIEHCFVSCKDAILFSGVLQRTLRKKFTINSYTVRYLMPTSLDEVPYDMFFLIGIHSLWKTRMQDRNAEPIISSRTHFIRMAIHLKDVYDELDFRPDWYPILVKCLASPLFLCSTL